MTKVLIIEHCRQCHHFENNMYHGLCCWHPKVCKPHPEGRTPRKIKINGEIEEYSKPPIPKWCPLDDVK